MTYMYIFLYHFDDHYQAYYQILNGTNKYKFTADEKPEMLQNELFGDKRKSE
jgi:hypothetical protein